MLNLWLNPDCKGGLRAYAGSIWRIAASAGWGSCSCLSKLGFLSSNSPLREAKMPSLMLRLKASALPGLKKITAKQVLKLEVTSVTLFIRSYEPWPWGISLLCCSKERDHQLNVSEMSKWWSGAKVLPAKLQMIRPLLSFQPVFSLRPIPKKISWAKLIRDHWNEHQSQQQFTSNTSWCPLLEDPNTKNYRKSAHQTNTTHVSPGAVSEQTPIRRYPEQIHHVNWKRITKNSFYQKLEFKKHDMSNYQDVHPTSFLIWLHCSHALHQSTLRNTESLGNPEAASGPTKPHKGLNWKRKPSSCCCFLDSKKTFKMFQNQTPGS